MYGAVILSGVGKAAIWVATISLLIGIVVNMLQGYKSIDVRRLAHLCIVLAFSCVTVASAVLMLLLCARQYEVAYVAAYTSNELPLKYRISAFWAGQEGSMLLWAWFGLLIGIVLVRVFSSLGKNATSVMALFSSAQLFLLVALICKSPFEMLPHRPTDGQGLNPLLCNFWMTIHPPLMLCGYALTSVPYALSLALMRESENLNVLGLVRRWALLAWLVLGAGIIAGAYWSYEVLGWGGYWGWDPVENASLVPWLLITALLHALAIQRRNGATARMCASLCILAYVSVIYATFITRSGILSEVSVHVFGEAHGLVNAVLLTFLIAYIAIGAITLACHWHGHKKRSAWTSVYSLNFVLWCASLLLMLMAFVVELGTSLPLLTKPFGTGFSASPSFYNRALAPMALALLLLLGMGAYYQVGPSMRLLTLSLLLASAVAVAAFLHGMQNPYHIAVTLISIAPLSISLGMLWRLNLRSWRYLGSLTSHIGISLLMLGISLSSSFERSHTLKLASGQSEAVLGHVVSCVIENEGSHGNRTDARMTLAIKLGEREQNLQMRIYDSPYGIVRQPGIKTMLLRDIYASPIELLHDAEHATLVLRKGEGKQALGMNIRFVKFDVGEHAAGHKGEFIARAILEVHETATGARYIVSPGLTGLGEGVDDSLPDKSAVFSILAMNADEGLIKLSVERRKALASSLHAVVELSIKPFMNLLRLGSILILIGGLLSLAGSGRIKIGESDNAEFERRA